MPHHSVYTDLVEDGKAEFFHEAERLSDWLDVLWKSYVPGRQADHHHFTKEELQQRLVMFGVWMASWMFFVCVLAVLAVLKRQHGSVSEAYDAFKSMKRRDIVRVVLQGKQYNRLSEDSDDDSEDDDGNPRRTSRWFPFSGQAAEEEVEDGPPDNRYKVSEAAREKDRQRLLEQEKKMADGEDVVAESATDKRKEIDLEIGQRRKGERTPTTLASKSQDEREREKQMHLLEFQAEEVTAQRGSVPLLQKLKVPISCLLFLGYILFCTLGPFLSADEASCKTGLPWEAHMPFFQFFILVKLWEVCLLAFDTSVPGKISLPSFVVKFGCSFLAFLDGYSDANAIIIAHTCGSSLWHWMAICFAIGVVLFQWVFLGVLSLWCDSSNTCFFKMMHMDALAECSAMKPADKHALTTWRLVNVFRFLFEDLPQSVLQTIFVLTVKKNPVMIISIALGAFSSALAIYSASKRAAAAIGTNFTYLQAVSDMQAAMDRDDPMAVFEALAAAEKSGANADTLLEKTMAAEEKFKFLSAQPFANMSGKDQTEAPELVVRAASQATPADAYPRRRRTEHMAQRVAKNREKALRARELSDSAAAKRGDHHEGKHAWRLYTSRRRTVDFAVTAQEQRETRLAALVKEGPGCCHGSRPKQPNEKADAKWSDHVKVDAEGEPTRSGQTTWSDQRESRRER